MISEQKTALLWTGGKDCGLVLHLLNKQTDYLITLVPTNYEDHSFKAHSIALIKQQAKSLNLPILFIEVKKPYEQGYKAAFAKIKNQYHITKLYSGDINFYDKYPNIIANSCKFHNIELISPLWHRRRKTLMKLMLDSKMTVQITWLSSPLIPKKLLGAIIDERVIGEIKQLGIDLSGEKGEYHTMVLNSPLFLTPLSPLKFDHYK